MSRTRGVKREPIALPCKVREYKGYDDTHYERIGRLRRDRNFAPYQEGDVFWFWDDGKIKAARVWAIVIERSLTDDHLYPAYRVQVATKDGHWAGIWKTAYPGFIQQAYFHDRDESQPRDLPQELTKETLTGVTP